MTPLPFHWPYALVFWLVFLWAFAPEFRLVQRAKRDQTASDGRSLQVIAYGGGLAFVLGFWIAWVPILLVPAPARVAVFILGVATMIAGSLLRRHCFKMLGRSFTGDVRVQSDQEVVSSGAYRFLRHPSYSAGILMNVGIGLALGSWASALIVMVGAFAVYAYRIRVEERTLVATIGEPYRQFMAGRKRMVPFIY